MKEGGTNPLTRIARKALVDVFDRLGGVDGLERWARKHPGQFYTLFVKSAPREREANSLGTGIVINVGSAAERPVIEVEQS
jgi:hypothetical protein